MTRVRDSRPNKGKRHFSASKCPDLFWFPSSLSFNGYCGFSVAVKQSGHEAEY